MDREGHSSCTCSEAQILKVHSQTHGVNVHARIEWDLTEISTEQQTVFILRSINSNHVGVSIEIRIRKATED